MSVGQTRTMNGEITGASHIRGLQNLDKYEKFNLIEINIDTNKILETLQCYRKGYKFCLIVDGLLFSTTITNEANVPMHVIL